MAQRTDQQNRALWLYFTWVADTLNNAGLDLRAVLKPEVEIPWSKQLVHDHLWVPIQKLMLGKESTTELEKGEIDKVFETFNRHLARHGVSLEFPSEEKRSEFFEAMEMRGKLDYPVADIGDPVF